MDVDQDDFVTPYFPRYRQGESNEDAVSSEDGGLCFPTADLNGDGTYDINYDDDEKEQGVRAD